MTWSIVEYFGQQNKSSCGYCKGKQTSFSHGMWAHIMTPQDYQDLIDRGWRRSGKYCYKPTMHETCCPQYTIRCDALEFKPTKSNRKKLKKFRQYVLNDSGANGKKSHKIAELAPEKRNPLYSSDDNSSEGESEECDGGQDDVEDFEAEENANQTEKKLRFDTTNEASLVGTRDKVDKPVQSPREEAKVWNDREASVEEARPVSNAVAERPKKGLPKPGSGPDPNKPKPRKAKEIRREKAAKKAAAAGGIPVVQKQQKNADVTLETLCEFFFRQKEPGKHSLELSMVRATSEDEDFQRTLDESFDVYRKYQVMIHKDKASQCTMSQFQRFLCNSPILEGASEVQPTNPAGASGNTFPPNYFPRGYGGYHQQYRLDGKIICVAVLDILPDCVSSVYLYYDPDYAFLSLGTISALLEISYVRQLHKHWSPKIRQYYMGFYIHSCPKMRYKGQYNPSSLLCPQTFAWVDVRACIGLLDKSKYCRLNVNSDAPDQLKLQPSKQQLGRVMVFYQHRPHTYSTYKNKKASADESEDVTVAEYLNLVGEGVSRSMLLFRSANY